MKNSVDIGLRNARLNFRQQELTHICDCGRRHRLLDQRRWHHFYGPVPIPAKRPAEVEWVSQPHKKIAIWAIFCRAFILGRLCLAEIVLAELFPLLAGNSGNNRLADFAF